MGEKKLSQIIVILLKKTVSNHCNITVLKDFKKKIVVLIL